MSNIVSQLLKQAQQIRYDSKTSCVQLENYLYYQKLELSSNSKSLILCGSCSRDRAVVKESFKRAFKSLTIEEQAQFYLKNCKYVADFLERNGCQSPSSSHYSSDRYLSNGNQIGNRIGSSSMGLADNGEHLIRKQAEVRDRSPCGRWNIYNVQILPEQKIIRIIELKIEIDLHYFLLRKSVQKSKPIFVLQATEGYSDSQTLKVSPVKSTDYQELYAIFEKLSDVAHRESIVKLMIEEKKFPKKAKSSKFRLMKCEISENKQLGTVPMVEEDNITKGALLKVIEQVQQVSRLDDNTGDKILQKIPEKQFLIGLNTFQNFVEVKAGIFHQKEGRKVRRVFKFQSQQLPNFQWLIDQLLKFRTFRQWKPSLQMIQLLVKLPAEDSYVMHQIDFYKNKVEIDYVYVRHYTIIENAHYFIDKSVRDNNYGPQCTQGQTRGMINHSLWRLKKINNDTVQVMVEADIDHRLQNDRQSQQKQKKMTQQFIGQFRDVLKLRYNQEHQVLLCDNDIEVDTIDFERDNLSEIDDGQARENKVVIENSEDQDSQTEFYSIDDSQNSCSESFSALGINSKLDSNSSSELESGKKVKKDKLNNIELKEVRQNSNKSALQQRHIINPLPFNNNKTVLKSKNGHFFWGKQWKVQENGSLLNLNQEKIKVQSSVLKLMAKREGKSITNTSMPIQIFDQVSLLERLCMCLTYGPIFLEKAAKSSDPVQKFKAVVAFAVGQNLNFIEMQMAFNPIIGQTFQGMIDGCPCYGEQISHHPSLSSIFMKGRGYTIYSTKQPKIEMRMNSASGINTGFTIVSFNERDIYKNTVKFSSTRGQISGLVSGPRVLKLTGKSIFLDKENKLFCQIKYGKVKFGDELSSYEDYLEGSLFQVHPNFEFAANLPKPTKQQITKQLGIFRGRWTDKLYYNSQVIFDVNQQAPCILEECLQCLQSHSNKREDIKLRKKLLWGDAQEAKEELEEFQRYDMKLRRNTKN